ncbi:MAG: cytidine deaminase [Chthoniobacterales bacterium]
MNSELLSTALSARQRSYAPYSGFAVGAALRTRTGAVFCGANIENISLGLTMCAERVCVGSALAAGHRDFDALAIAADSRKPIVPCGACRQVLAEFAPGLRIFSRTLSGTETEFSLSDLLPHQKDGILEKFHVEHA